MAHAHHEVEIGFVAIAAIDLPGAIICDTKRSQAVAHLAFEPVQIEHGQTSACQRLPDQVVAAFQSDGSRRTPGKLQQLRTGAEADLLRCGALRDYWYVACRSPELTTKKPLARTILGLNLVLFRDGQGKPAALRDRCLHRNARLSAGDTFDGKLGCPYHGWVYDSSGACVEIPSLGPAQAGLDEHGLQRRPSDVGKVRSFPVQEQDGLVWITSAPSSTDRGASAGAS